MDTEIQIELGDTVVYTPKFLASIGCSHTDPLWFAKGLVVAQHTAIDTLVQVDWSDGDGPKTINKFNIARPMTARSVDVPVWYNAPKGKAHRVR